MKLHELTPDQILEIIEKRSEKLAEQEEAAAVAKADLEAYESSQAVAVRDTGVSITEAKERVRAYGAWKEHYLKAQKEQIEAARLKRSYQLAVTAAEMWRSENATRRAIGLH